MNIDIKPCPFCGKTPDVNLGIKPDYYPDHYYYYNAYIYVVCKKCEYCVESKKVQEGTPINKLVNEYNKVITKWNERVNNE